MPGMATSNGEGSILRRILNRFRPASGMSDAEVAERLRPHGQTLDFGLPVELDATIPPDEIHLRQGGATVGRIVNVEPPDRLPHQHEPDPPRPFSQEWYDALPPEGQEAYDEWQRRPQQAASFADDGSDFVIEDEPNPMDFADEIRDQQREGK